MRPKPLKVVILEKKSRREALRSTKLTRFAGIDVYPSLLYGHVLGRLWTSGRDSGPRQEGPRGPSCHPARTRTKGHLSLGPPAALPCQSALPEATWPREAPQQGRKLGPACVTGKEHLLLACSLASQDLGTCISCHKPWD